MLGVGGTKLQSWDKQAYGIVPVPETAADREFNRAGWDINLVDIAKGAIEFDKIYSFEGIKKVPSFERICCITFRPIFQDIGRILRKAHPYKKTYIHTIDKVKLVRVAKYPGGDIELKKIIRRSFKAQEEYVVRELTREWLGNRADILNSFEIKVGVLPKDMNKIHLGPFSSVSYSTLFLLLLSLGYDPLLPIREADFVKTIGMKMGRIIVDRINAHNLNGSPMRIREYLAPLARQIKSYVKDYIAGGVKPQLDKATIRNRVWAASSGNAKITPLYPNGITEPLSETGALEKIIDSKVIGIHLDNAIQNVSRKYHELYEKKQDEFLRKKAAQFFREQSTRKTREKYKATSRDRESIEDIVKSVVDDVIKKFELPTSNIKEKVVEKAIENVVQKTASEIASETQNKDVAKVTRQVFPNGHYFAGIELHMIREATKEKTIRSTIAETAKINASSISRLDDLYAEYINMKKSDPASLLNKRITTDMVALMEAAHNIAMRGLKI